MSLITCTTEAQLDAAFSSAVAGDEIFLDVASINFTTGHAWTAPANVILRGRGSTSITGGNSLTVVTDTWGSGNPILDISTNVSGTFRMYGITFIGGSAQQNAGVVAFGGQCKSFRVDHCRFDAQTSGVAHSLVQLDNYITGVMDHCIWDLFSVGNGVKVHYRNYAGTQDNGDASWAADTNFGTEDCVVFEDNIYNGNSNFSCINDSLYGAKSVFRFNTINRAFVQTHPSRTGSELRGGRSTEIYLNAFVSSNSFPTPHADLFFHASGPALTFLNTAPEGYVNFHNARASRRSWDLNPDHREAKPPFGWGWGGPPPQSGTVTVAVDGVSVTKTAGTNFNTGWSASDMIYIGTSTEDAVRISSVTDTTHLSTLDAAPIGAGQAYQVGSNWDGNTTITGYPHLDQPGRGKGDLITGTFPSTKLNAATGKDYSDPGAWPRQALEPMYDFLNTFTTASGWGGVRFSGHAGVIDENRDYYLEAASFDGTVGVGVGTLAQMNTFSSATNGVGFWVTDVGDWRTGTPSQGITSYTGQGSLYIRQGGAWVLYYEPLPYPHRLVGATVPEPPSPIAPTQPVPQGKKMKINWIKPGRK